jgi:hypothetical protein
MRHQRASEANAATLAKAAETAAARKQWTFAPDDPRGPGWLAPPDPQNPSGIFKPVEQGPTIIPRRPPGPQSALPEPGGPNVAAFDPNDPENAPPYQVAGPPVPPPQQPPQNVPVVQAPARPPQPATTGLPPDFEERIAPLPPGKQEELRGLATYRDDPAKLKFATEQQQRRYFQELRDLVPGWSPEGFRLREEERKKAEALAETEPKAQATQLGQEKAKIELEAVKDAKAAADLQPLLDDAVKQWEQLIKFQRFGGLHTGTGLVSGSTAARLPQRLLSSTEEQLRQGYERTLASLRAKITSTMNQGQGAVSNYERQMYNQIFPEFTTSNPQGDLATLRQLQAKGRQVAGIGRETGLGKSTPGFLADRPAVERSNPDKTYQFDKATAESYRGRSDVARARAQQLIKDGADPAKVKDALRQIDPRLADEF